MPDFENMNQQAPGSLLERYQTGQLSDDEQKAIDASVANIPTFKQRLRGTPVSTGKSEEYTEQARARGFGLSRYDTDYYPEKDIEEGRALAQSSFSKIGTGIMKGGVTAAATALNTTLGTVFGVGSALYELALDADGDGRGVMDTIDAGVNNWLSEQTTKLQQWSEKQFPNYRTREERSEQYQKEWYKHIGSANFIGDSILKNFGFTIGAVAGGVAWSRLLGSAMAKRLANNIMKGAVAAADGNAEAGALMEGAAAMLNAGKTEESIAALSRAREAFERGAIGIVGQNEIVQNALNAGKAINKMKAQLQLYGAIVGAMGEGTVEGLMAKQEFLDEFNKKTDEAFAAEYGSIVKKIIDEGDPHLVVLDSYADDNGNIIERRPRLSDAGVAELRQREIELTKKYDELRDFAAREADRLASTTYLLNLPILTASNAVQFGRMFSGGWKTTRSAASKGIAGGVSMNEAKELVGDYASKYAKNTGKKIAGLTILDALKVSGAEAYEEMSQGAVSTGAKRVANTNIAAFNNDAYDAQAVNSYRRWFEEMSEGGAEYLGDMKNWQEGFLGALTGLFGIPGRRWGGGVIGAYQEAKEKVNTTNTAASKLNSLVNSDEFQNRWKAYIRHMKYDNEMQDAIEADDEKAWQDANDKQIVSDIISFADAGKLDDLNQIADYFSKDADADELRQAVGEKTESGTNPVNAPEKLVSSVQDRAKEIKETIQLYKDLYDALSARAPMDASDDFLHELVATTMLIKRNEQRFLQMYGETLNALEPHMEMLSSFSEEGRATEDKHKQQFQDMRNSLENIFGAMILPTELPKRMRDNINNILTVMEGYAKSDEELSKKIADMRQLTQDRQEFYYKLQNLQAPKGQKRFEEQAITPEKVADAAEEAIAREEVKDLNTLDDIRAEYSKRGGAERAEFIQSLEKIADENKNAKTFVEMKRRFDDFVGFIHSENHTLPRVASNPLVNPEILVSDLLERVKDENELLALPDSAFMDFDVFRSKISSNFPITNANYVDAKNIVRKAMDEYVRINNLTVARTTMSSQQVAPAKTESTNPTGPDAAQPGSVSPTPVFSMREMATKVEPVEKKEEQKPEDVDNPPMPEQRTGNGLALDTIDNIGGDEKINEPEVSVSGKGKQSSSWHSSVPEIDNRDEQSGGKGAVVARRAIDNRDPELYKSADLRDYPDSSAPDAENYRDTWNKLKELGVFETVNTDLHVGDEVEFVYDPNVKFDPKYGKQILVRRKSDHKVLTILHSKSKETKYVGLRSFRKIFFQQQEAFNNEHPSDPFVFGKTSKIWALRSGYIAYDYSENGERGIIDIPNYSDDAPIVMVGSDGRMRVVRGSDDSVVDKVSSTFNSAEDNIQHEKVGYLYYLVRNPHGQYEYVPIALRTAHFNTGNMNDERPAYAAVRSAIKSLVDGVRHSYGEEDFLKKMVSDLSKLIDLHNIRFTFSGTGSDTVLNITMGEQGGTQIQLYASPISDIKEEDVLNVIAGLDRNFQISARTEKSQADKIDMFIKSGVITSNAERMRAKGSDFYINPWNEAAGEFGPVTEEQRNAIDEVKPEKPVDDTPPVDESAAPVGSDQFDGVGDLIDGMDVPMDRAPEVLEASNDAISDALSAARVDNDVLPSLAESIKNMSRFGHDAMVEASKAIETLDAYAESYTTSQRTNAFRFILSTAFTDAEKEELSRQLNGEKNIVAIMVKFFDYLNEYNSTPNPLFDRIADLIYSSQGVVTAIRQLESFGQFNTEPKEFAYYGEDTDPRVFANLPESLQTELLKDHTEEEYNAASEEMQDQILACLGVFGLPF